jgi:NADH dehydrogenase FAD-containing subunit
VAEQQGRYLARYLNAEARALEKGDSVEQEPFKYRQLGAMASVGARLVGPQLCQQQQQLYSILACALCVGGAAAATRRIGLRAAVVQQQQLRTCVSDIDDAT